MKILAYLVLGLVLAAKAGADPNRYEWRSFGGRNVDLQPLFGWWFFVPQATNGPLDITGIDSNKLAIVSNLWKHLPERPLPQWSRILASEDQITVAGPMWKLNATIEPAPMMIRHETIYLRDPPVREIVNYKQARENYQILQNAQASDVSSEQNLQSNITVQAVAFWTNPPNYAPFSPQNTYNQAVNLEYKSALTVSNLNAAHARTQSRDAQILPLQQFLASFPDSNVYWLDHFALRTGKKIGGIEVYDLGTSDRADVFN